MPERAIQEMKNHLNSRRVKFVHALFRHTCTLIACRNGVIGKNDFTLTKTVTILFVHERGNSVHASRGYAARSVPEFPRSWTNNIVTITYLTWVFFQINWCTSFNGFLIRADCSKTKYLGRHYIHRKQERLIHYKMQRSEEFLWTGKLK